MLERHLKEILYPDMGIKEKLNKKSIIKKRFLKKGFTESSIVSLIKAMILRKKEKIGDM